MRLVLLFVAGIVTRHPTLFVVLSKRIKKTKAPTPENPESKALREAQSCRSTQLKKLRSLCDKADKDINEGLAQVTKLTTKGYPQDMVTFLTIKCKDVQEQCNSCLDFYSS